ncbi:MAG: hypothetical protein ACE5M4_12220 [Anaerolineales bacterium]
MAEASMMDRVFHYVMGSMVARGQAPHYTEIAGALSVNPEEGKELLHELMRTGI